MPFAGERDAALATQARADGRRALLTLTPHERHRKLLDDYARFYGSAQQPPAAAPLTDQEVLAQHHRFLRTDEDDAGGTWEQRLAAKYYAKLFKEYCIADLSGYKEQRLGLRWRTQAEVVTGKGQFTCGAKRCSIGDGLVSYEVLFAYEEAGEAKSALVKLRVCPECAYKLNYRRAKALRRVEKLAARSEAREHKRRRADAGAVSARPRHGDADAEADTDDAPEAAAPPEAAAAVAAQTDAEFWGAAAAPAATEPSREDEYDAYFSGMFA